MFNYFAENSNTSSATMSNLINLENYRDIRFHDFHIYQPGKTHNFSLDLEQFPGIPNSYWFEKMMLNNSDLIHRSLSKWYYSFYISIGYLIAIVSMKAYMHHREPYRLKPLLIGWNVLLAIFSIMGTIRCMPEFVHVLRNYGLKYSYSQSTYYYDYRLNVWYLFFTLSKAIELLDTAFVLLRKRKLIALHWVHHLLTLNYSWFVFPDAPATARWMVNMNFFVHSLMYTYYAVKVANIHVPRFISLTITTLQITQMFIGLAVNYKALQLKLLGMPCDASLSVLTIGVTLYGLFAVLFINFFIYTYIIRRSGKIHSAVKQLVVPAEKNVGGINQYQFIAKKVQ